MYSLSLHFVLAFTESDHVGTALESDAEERLGESIGRLCRGGCVLYFDSVGFDVIADEEVLHFDVLAPVADLAVVGDVECALAVDE